MPNQDYWNIRYKEGQTGWDVGNISQPLKEYFDQIENHDLSVLIPGCGNAYEAQYLLENGFTNVTLVDISDILIRQLEERFYPKYQDHLHLIHGDFFEMQGSYDLIVEQTFFCALDPNLRENYAQKMNELLTENGKLVGVMFNRDFDHDGPPFGGNREEYLDYFTDRFHLKHFSDCYNSIPPRQGSELFICLSKK